jgi:hypothetical protein
MYNEVERLILDSIVRCSYCDSKNVKIYGSTTTIAACGDSAETSFKYHVATHDHDFNKMDASYDCFDCKRRSRIIPLNACWCGWTQVYYSSKYGYRPI